MSRLHLSSSPAAKTEPTRIGAPVQLHTRPDLVLKHFCCALFPLQGSVRPTTEAHAKPARRQGRERALHVAGHRRLRTSLCPPSAQWDARRAVGFQNGCLGWATSCAFPCGLHPTSDAINPSALGAATQNTLGRLEHGTLFRCCGPQGIGHAWQAQARGHRVC